MRSAPSEIRSQRWHAGWTFRVYRLEAWYPPLGHTLPLKWKAAPPGLERRNNTPRREIAAYRIQKWFLDPEHYVVPTTLGLCMPLELHAAIDAGAEPNPPGSRCVFGTLSIWLQHVQPAEEILDAERFREDRRYARHVAHYNLLTYLIENRDTRPANVLVSTDPAERRVFSIDNGVAFGEPLYNFLRSHWNEIRVPALSRGAIERLRRVSPADLDALAVVAEFRLDGRGVLRETAPSAPFEAERGVRMRDGVLQLGLRPDEICDLAQRLEALLAAVDEGEIPLF